MPTRLIRLSTVALLFLTFFAARCEVHGAGELIESKPADGAKLEAVPEQIELRFDESVDPETVQIVAIAPNGARADSGTSETTGEGTRSAALRPGLSDGRYLVYWLVAEPGARATAFGDLTFTVEGASPCQPVSNATPRPPAEQCLANPPTGAPGDSIASNGISVTVSVSGDQAGPVALQATVTDSDGNPIDEAAVWFRARHLEMDHGELPYLAASEDSGVYTSESVGMGMGGEWRIAVDVIRPGELPVTVFVEQTMVE
jgi:methionine-rich copper-binding protein CopC